MLASKELAPRPGGPLLIVGAGARGRAHLEAIREDLGVTGLFIVSRTRERADALTEHARSLRVVARVVDDPAEALEKATLSASTSKVPVLTGQVPEEAEASRWEVAMSLQEALSRPDSLAGLVLFESVRHAAWDLAAAHKAFAGR